VPAHAQDAKPAQPKGVKSRGLVGSTGAIASVALSIPAALSGQVVELAPGGQTGKQRNLAPSFLYVLEGTLVIETEGGPIGVSGAATLGGLARDAGSGDLCLGEENGTRIWRLSPDERLTLYAVGLRRLAGGGTLAFDRLGRLVIVAYADPFLSQPEERAPPGLEQLREGDYRGPLVFRLAP